VDEGETEVAEKDDDSEDEEVADDSGNKSSKSTSRIVLAIYFYRLICVRAELNVFSRFRFGRLQGRKDNGRG
jgi:hypothetical protein